MTLPGFTSCLQVLKVDAQLLALNMAIDAQQAEQGDALSVCAFVTFKTEEGRAACMRANPSSTGRRVFLRKDLRFRWARAASLFGMGRHCAPLGCLACLWVLQREAAHAAAQGLPAPGWRLDTQARASAQQQAALGCWCYTTLWRRVSGGEGIFTGGSSWALPPVLTAGAACAADDGGLWVPALEQLPRAAWAAVSKWHALLMSAASGCLQEAVRPAHLGGS